MFKALCCRGDNAGALNLLRNMESHGHCMPNVVIYNTILDSLCKDQLSPQALRLFHEMKSKGIPPDVVTYATIIRGLCNLGQWKEAEELLTKMLSNNITPDVETYNMLIDMYCKEGNVVEAHSIFEHMIKKGQAPDVITYSTLVDGYCLIGDMNEAHELINFISRKWKTMDVPLMNALSIQSLEDFLMVWIFKKALGLVSIMRSKDFVADNHTISSLVGLLSNPAVSDADKYLIKSYFET